MKPRVVWFATARSPYNDFLFGELAKHFDLTVYVRIDKLSSHPWELASTSYECRSLRGRLLSAIREIWAADLVVVVGWDHWSHLLISLLLPPTVSKCFWTDTPDTRSRGLWHYLLRSLVVHFIFWRFDSLWATGRPGCVALEILGCPPEKILSFPFYVDNDGIAKARNEAEIALFRQQHGGVGRIVLICVGRLIAKKKFDEAIRAMTSVDQAAVLWVVGDGPERSRLLELAKALGLEGRVRFFGWLQPSETALAVDACDIFVHPAEIDPFPTVVLDAMARGKPIIGNPTSGSVADRVVDGWNGYLVGSGQVEVLAQRINRLVEDRNALAEFGIRSRETACKYPVSQAISFIQSFAGRKRRLAGILGKDAPRGLGSLSSSARMASQHESKYPGSAQEPAEPRRYQICKNCVMDTTDSKIVFDEGGVCDHCNNFYRNILPNWHTDQRGWVEIQRKVEKIKKDGKDRPFDCILGISGGLDSSYLAHSAVKMLGLRPLVFHVDGGWNSETAVHNIAAIVDKLGLDLYTEVIDWEEMKDFQLAFFKAGVSNIDVPQDHAFIATLYHFAYKHDIHYILNGGNFSTECVNNPMEWMYYGTDMAQIHDIQRRFGTRPLKKYPLSGILWHKLYLRYLKGIEVVKPLNYIPYVKKDAIRLLEKEYGWKYYGQKHFESRFTKFYEGYWLPTKFGYDTRKVQFSSLILTKQMTREEALDMLAKPVYDDTSIAQDFEYIASKLGISVEELEGYLSAPNRSHRDYRSNELLFTLGARALKWAGVERSVKR